MEAPLVYTFFSLSQVAFVLGLIFTIAYSLPLKFPEASESWLRSFPRNYPIGVGLTAAALIWFLWLIQYMDLMEYTPHRPKFLVGFTLIAVASVIFLKDFLAARALGVLLLLLAKVLLDAAFLRDESSRYLITILAYLMVVKGIAFVAWPYLMRDGIDWLYNSRRRPAICFTAGVILGVILIIFGVFIY